MSIFREFNINMIPGKPPLIIHVSQYESDFVYTFNLVSGKSVLAIPETAIAIIRGTKRDGNGYSKEASLDTENNKVVVIGEVQMTACAGRNVFELAIINDEKVICTANFFLDVERAPLDAGTIQSESVLRELQAIIDSAATATQAAEEASASAAEAAESARTLTIDPTFTQSGQPADAKETGDKVDAISDYANIEFLDFQSGHIKIWVAVGKTVNLARQTNSAGVNSAIIDVSENDTVVISGATASGYRMYGFVDANNALISVSASSVLSEENLLITAPANASKAIINLVSGSAFKGLGGYDYFQPLKKTFSDADNAIPNRIYVTTGGASNVPETAGVLITYRYERNNGTGYAQTFVGSTNNVYNRIKWGANGGAWTTWRKSISDNDANEYMQGAISGNAISDADNAMPNRVYVFTSAVSNIPEDNGTLMTFRYAYSTGTQVGQVQIFVGTSGTMYNRIKWGGSGGTWTSWKKLLTELSTPVYDTYTVGIFEKFAVIGDSFASGEIVVTAGSYVDYYYQSWGQVLARRVGNTCLNLSEGGLSTRTWLTSAKGLSLLNSSDAQNLYIIALGINDNSLGSEYIGTAADIGTSADSFYGNYSKIIDAIRTKAPNAKIILSKTAFNYGNFPAINSAIETIATHYGVPYINPITDEYMGSSDFNGKMMNGHPTATMYGAMATAYERMIAKCQGENYDYFKDYTGV